MGTSGSSLSSCSFIYCHKGGYTSIEEPNSIWPDWFNFVPALSSVPPSTTPPVASVHYLQHWLYVVVECSHVSSKRGPQSRALPLVGPIPCMMSEGHGSTMNSAPRSSFVHDRLLESASLRGDYFFRVHEFCRPCNNFLSDDGSHVLWYPRTEMFAGQSCRRRKVVGNKWRSPATAQQPEHATPGRS